MQTFTEYIAKENEKDPDNIFNPPTESYVAIEFLKKYLLGEEYTNTDPVWMDKIPYGDIGLILHKYSKKYRKLERKYKSYDPNTLIESQRLFNIAVDYLLGENWYDVNPVSAKQVNTQALHEILMKYSRKYRKEVKQYRKKNGFN